MILVHAAIPAVHERYSSVGQASHQQSISASDSYLEATMQNDLLADSYTSPVTLVPTVPERESKIAKGTPVRLDFVIPHVAVACKNYCVWHRHLG